MVHWLVGGLVGELVDWLVRWFSNYCSYSESIPTEMNLANFVEYEFGSLCGIQPVSTCFSIETGKQGNSHFLI